MPLEALISLRHKGESDLKKRGDVLCVKLAGAPWGNEEVRIHQVVEWEDAELERSLTERKEAGESYPVIAYPYAVHEEVGYPEEAQAKAERPLSKHFVMKTRSSERVNLDALSAALKKSVLDPDTHCPKLSLKQYKRQSGK